MSTRTIAAAASEIEAVVGLNKFSITLSSSADVNGPAGLGILLVAREASFSGQSVTIHYTSGSPPAILSQSGSIFVTGSPSAGQIQIKDRSGSGGIAFRAGSTYNGAALRIAALVADP